MYSDPVAYFYNGIMPAYEHYVELSKKKDNKKALLLNTAIEVAGKLFHFREELEPLFPAKTFRRPDVAKLCPDYDWVGDVFNAMKHKELNRKDRIIKDKTHIEETIVWTYFPYKGETVYPPRFYSTVQIRVLVTPLKNRGKIRNLLEIANHVLNFWADFLVDNELTATQQSFHYAGNDIIPEELLDANGGALKPKADEMYRWSAIARYYEPKTGTFGRWGFNKDGSLQAVPIVEDAPNAKCWWSFSADDNKGQLI